MRVHELMTENPATVSVRATVRQAVQLLAELDIRHLPVMQASTLVGFLSDRDLRETMGLEDPDERSARMDGEVSAVMSSNVFSVGPEDEVGEVIDLMVEQKLGAVPVVEDGALVGVVSYVDILREARELL